MIWYDMMYDEIADQSVPGHTLLLNLIRSTFQSLSHSHTQSKCVMVSAWPILDSSILEKQTVHSWLAYLPIYSRRFVGRKLPQNPPAGWSSINCLLLHSATFDPLHLMKSPLFIDLQYSVYHFGLLNSIKIQVLTCKSSCLHNTSGGQKKTV